MLDMEAVEAVDLETAPTPPKTTSPTRIAAVRAELEAREDKAETAEFCSTTVSHNLSNPDASRGAEVSSFLPAVVKSSRYEVVK